MKYEIELHQSQSKTIKIEADDMAQAIKKAYGKYSHRDGWSVESIDDKLLMGQDEGTGEPIFEDSDYYCCPETGIMELKKNVSPERVAG